MRASIRRWLTLAAVLAVLLGSGVCTAPARAALPVATLISNTVWVTSATSDTYTATCDTWVVSWTDVIVDTSVLTAVNGDTVWLPVTLTNRAGYADSFTLGIAEANGWPVTVWDSVGANPIPLLQVLNSNQTLSVLVAVAIPTGTVGGVGDSVTVSAVSGSDPGADDSWTFTVSSLGRLDHFGVVAPAAIFAGAPFGITVTAYDDSAIHVMTGYDTTVTITVDTGAVAPAVLATGSWANGVWAGNLTITGCFDTVNVTFSDGVDTRTVAIFVTNYWVILDQASYQGLTTPALITVWDMAADTPAGVLNTVQVQVTSTSDQTGITLTLVETGLATATFTGALNFTQGASRADAIQINDQGNFTVAYDPDGNGPATVVLVQANWIALVIQNLENVRSWPNPFRWPEQQEIVIQNLPSDPGMVIEIYNVAAQRIRTLRVGVEITASGNENLARWDGRNDAGDIVASGTYVYLVRSQYGVTTRKLTFIK